jgi:hypothetical protein
MPRFFYMLSSQMTITEGSSVLTVGCVLFDFIINLLTCLSDYLTACIALERTISVLKGASFNRKTSVRAVKFVVPNLIIILVLSFLHHPLHRRLIVDPRYDERLWCVLRFDHGWLETYDIVIGLVHTLGPFLTNLICAIVLLVVFSRTKQAAHNKERFSKVLKKLICHHKDLLITPLLIIAFKLPVLIIMLVIECVKTDWELNIVITAYILSLMPFMGTFFIFILPSQSYLKVFNERRSNVWKWIKK